VAHKWLRGYRWARVGAAGVLFALACATLAACNLTSMGEGGGNDPPDALDRIRSADLQPRFPQQPAATPCARNGQRPSTYYGTADQPAAPAQSTSTPSGDGFELNFENTPVTTVAKVVLGDILGLGYTIDPRVQGTVSLASGRPVAKKDVLFVLESVLRTSNAALLHDTAGYRIVPAGDAVGNGSVDRAAAGNSPEPGYGITVIPLRYVSVQTVSKLLDSFAAKAG